MHIRRRRRRRVVIDIHGNAVVTKTNGARVAPRTRRSSLVPLRPPPPTVPYERAPATGGVAPSFFRPSSSRDPDGQIFIECRPSFPSVSCRDACAFNCAFRRRAVGRTTNAAFRRIHGAVCPELPRALNSPTLRWTIEIYSTHVYSTSFFF